MTVLGEFCREPDGLDFFGNICVKTVIFLGEALTDRLTGVLLTVGKLLALTNSMHARITQT